MLRRRVLAEPFERELHLSPADPQDTIANLHMEKPYDRLIFFVGCKDNGQGYLI